MKKILFIIGSPKKNSFNRQFSKIAYNYLKDKAEVKYLNYSHIPLMSPDIENPRPKEIDEILDIVNDVDGIWIFASEYNLGYTASLKNLLDWLSRPVKNNDFDLGTFVTNKKVAITSVAGRSKGKFVIEKLVELLNYIGMDVFDFTTGVGLEKDDFVKDCPSFTKEDIASLKRQAESFYKEI